MEVIVPSVRELSICQSEREKLIASTRGRNLVSLTREQALNGLGVFAAMVAAGEALDHPWDIIQAFSEDPTGAG